MKQQRNRQRASTRIGPHPKYVLELMIGNLLGDGSLQKRGNATRFVFQQAGKNQEYLYWLHAQYAAYGYCSENIPKQSVRIGKGNIVRRVLRFRTWSYTSLNWLYDDFYKSPGGILIPWKKFQRRLTNGLHQSVLPCGLWTMAVLVHHQEGLKLPRIVSRKLILSVCRKLYRPNTICLLLYIFLKKICLNMFLHLDKKMQQHLLK
jgi:hypothetical protein